MKKRIARAYRAAYYGPLRCARVFRVRKYLPVVAVEKPVVSERHRFIYYPIPKTACTTVKSLILEAEGRIVPDDDEEVHVRIKENISTPVLPYDSYFKFTFVRNPWMRLVSCYFNKVFDLRPDRSFWFSRLYPGIRFEKMSFADFVRFVCRVPDDLCEPHFKPQSAFFDARRLDFAGRYERFSEDLVRLIERTGLDGGLRKWCDIRRMKSDNDRHYTDFYDAQTQCLVAEKYATDIERFGYRFGN